MLANDAYSALKVLHDIFSKGANVLSGPYVYDDKTAYRHDVREGEKSGIADTVALEAARKQLLATGFDVPNSWLTVDPVIRVHWSHDRTEHRQIGWVVEDRKAIRQVSRELWAAILRLEATNSDDTQDDTKKKNSNKARRPLTKEARACATIYKRRRKKGENVTRKEVVEDYVEKHSGSFGSIERSLSANPEAWKDTDTT